MRAGLWLWLLHFRYLGLVTSVLLRWLENLGPPCKIHRGSFRFVCSNCILVVHHNTLISPQEPVNPEFWGSPQVRWRAVLWPQDSATAPAARCCPRAIIMTRPLWMSVILAGGTQGGFGGCGRWGKEAIQDWCYGSNVSLDLGIPDSGTVRDKSLFFIYYPVSDIVTESQNRLRRLIWSLPTRTCHHQVSPESQTSGMGTELAWPVEMVSIFILWTASSAAFLFYFISF